MHVYIYEQLASLCGSPLASCIYKILIKIVARHNNAMRSPCCDKQGNNRGAWSKEEDQKLIDYIRVHGEVSWRSLPKAAGLLRCGKSCRLRWINYLRPDVKRGNFKEDEEDLIIKLHALLGNRWSLIAGRLPGRTDNEVKNYWNSHLRKKLKSKGIDPDNHRVTLRRPAERSGNASDLSTDVEYCSWPCAFSSATTLADQEMSSKRSAMNGLPDLNLDLAATCVPSKKSSGYNDETSDDLIAAGAACVDSSAGGGPASTTLLLFR